MNQTAYVQVTVANVWNSPQKVRAIDAYSASISQWLASMDDALRLDLLGRLETQLLYGEQVLVLQQEKDWVQVVIPSQSSSKDERGYPGWVHASHLVDHLEYDQAIASQPCVSVTATKSVLTFNSQKQLEISFMTTLPLLQQMEETVVVMTPSCEPASLPRKDVSCLSSSKGGIIEVAKRFLGLPYLWGGTSSYGFDCSGFVYRLMQSQGVLIPRDTHDQANQGIAVPSDQIQAGDLLFFAHEKGQGKIHHVGMAVDSHHFIHSPRTGKPVQVDPISLQPYNSEWCGTRRYIG